MKKQILVACCALNVMFTGCRLHVDETYVPSQLPPQSAVQSPVRLKTQSAEDSFSIESAVNTKLRLKIVFGVSEQNFSRKVAERLANAVLLDKAELTLNDPCDAVVTLVPEFELIDSDGGYFRVKCTQVSARIMSTRKVYATKTIEPPAMPRKLGLENAKNQYVNPVVNALSSYLGQELQKISNNDVSVTEMRFALQNIRQHADPTAISRQVEKISAVLNSMPGVINYTNVAQHTSQAKVTFRIVYLKDRYPQGLVNAINSKLETK